MVWVACVTCDLQVHATLSQRLREGVTCPECGSRLAAPAAPGEADEAAMRLRELEEHLRRYLESEEC